MPRRAAVSPLTRLLHHEHAVIKTWEVLFRVDGEMAARAKKMACDFGYDCDVPTPTVPSPSVPEAEKLVGYYGYPMVACARVQNQGPYLREWLEFHIAAGVGKRPWFVEAHPAACVSVI